MRTMFVVDPLDDLDAALDTSIGLMHAAQEQGPEVWVTEPRHLEAAAGRASAYARHVKLAPCAPAGGCRWTVPDPWYDAGPDEPVPLDEMDAVFMWAEPPVDPDYLAATYLLDLPDRGQRDLTRCTAQGRRPAGHVVLRGSCAPHPVESRMERLMTTAIVCSAVLGAAIFVLGFNVSLNRGYAAKRGSSQMPTDPADPLLIAQRAHGNATEYVPTLIALFLVTAWLAASPGRWGSSWPQP